MRRVSPSHVSSTLSLKTCLSDCFYLASLGTVSVWNMVAQRREFNRFLVLPVPALPRTPFIRPRRRSFSSPSNPAVFFQSTKKHPLGCFFWLGRRDSNPRVTESKSVALPLGDGPIYLKNCLFYKCSRTEKLCGFGDPSEIRTPDTLIKSQVLCQLS